jgi:hypothetical protein
MKGLPHDGSCMLYCETVTMLGIYRRGENVIRRMKL